MYITDQSCLHEIFESENQEIFLEWMSCDYEYFRECYRNICESYNVEKKYFNSLIVMHPIIKPKVNHYVPGGRKYCTPMPMLIHQRVINGIYFTLSDESMDNLNSSNPFKEAFGYVFEDYIHMLLEEHYKPDSELFRDFEYRRGVSCP